MSFFTTSLWILPNFTVNCCSLLAAGDVVWFAPVWQCMYRTRPVAGPAFFLKFIWMEVVVFIWHGISRCVVYTIHLITINSSMLTLKLLSRILELIYFENIRTLYFAFFIVPCFYISNPINWWKVVPKSVFHCHVLLSFVLVWRKAQKLIILIHNHDRSSHQNFYQCPTNKGSTGVVQK